MCVQVHVRERESEREVTVKNKLMLADFILVFMFQRMKYVFLCCLSANKTFFLCSVSAH